ncbi:hypothetical protein AIGOOFII_0069 [Methylobacterium marchantiae]|nr:hypothetical protein AIGOOFII_0069 [Methylobacterium marchantiae]
MAAGAGADLVDAKDPDRGALGALPVETVRAIVAAIAGGAVSSAVAGEPQEAAALPGLVAAMAGTGIGYVKVAVRPDFDAAALAAAARAAPGRLIAVLFAGTPIPENLVGRLAEAGFAGVMIDTAAKDGRRLTDLLPAPRLSAFTADARAHGLLSGLAGSLAIADIAVLSAHRPDYLGFRGGLCFGNDRTRGLDPERVALAIHTLRGLDRRNAA